MQDSLISRLRYFFSSSTGDIPLKEKIAVSIYKLKNSLERMKQISSGLGRRDQKFFNKCIASLINKDNARAMIFANECSEIRKIAKLVISSELAIEQAILRLQTVREISDVMVAVAPIADIVQETSSRLTGVIPSVTNKLDEVNNMLKTSLNEMSVKSPLKESVGYNEEALTVLKEANAAAEETIREKFPELPTEIIHHQEKKVPVALTTNGNSETIKNDLKDQVFDYIKARDGRVSITQCASHLGVFPNEIEKTILQLKEEKKISLE
jgi:division protein CdvB (Snf7/Vps24/ESCRT-III family)